MNFFCITSRDVKKESFFKGYAFTDNALIVNDAGYQKFCKESGELFNKVKDGRFLLLEKQGDIFNLRADPSGQSIIYYYVNGDFWVVSDSLLELSRKLNQYGYKKSIYQSSVDVFKNERLSLIGGQLVSNNTVIEDVKVLGLKKYIELSWGAKNKGFKIKTISDNFSYDSYEELLHDIVKSWRGRLRAISMLTQESFLALSGGVDSRAILALWSSSTPSKKINCHSHKKYENEYEIAKQLCSISEQNFGPGMKGLKSISLSPAEAYDLSMLGNSSIKTNYGFRRNAMTTPQLHFIGGCAIGSFYMKSSYKARSARLVSQFGSAGENVAGEILESLKEIGVDKQDPWAMFHHYYNHRARYHYGNDAYTRFGSIQVQPLLDARLHEVSSLIDKEYVQGNGLVRDVILMANKKLLDVPFDSPDKIKAGKSIVSDARSGEEGLNYKVFYGDELQDFSFKGADAKPESEWYKDLKKILVNKKASMTDMALELGFSDSYISQATSEIDLFNKKSKLRKAGVLLGINEVLNA